MCEPELLFSGVLVPAELVYVYLIPTAEHMPKKIM